MNLRLWTDTTKPFNEDAGGVGSNWICVIDGATPLHPSAEANEVTSKFTQTLVEVIDKNGLSPLRMEAQISNALQEVNNRLGIHGATATISAVAWDDDVVRTTSLGDSIILVETEQSILTIQDPDFVGREDRLLSPVIDAMKRGVKPQTAYAMSTPSLRSERARRNTSEGVWILSDSVPSHEISSHLSMKAFPRHSVSRVAAMTDGMWRAVDLFKLVRPDELLACAETNEMGSVLRRLKEAEERDPQRAHYPRFSYRDDATLAFGNLGQ